MSGQPEVSPRAELDRCLIIAATVGNKWLLYTVIRDVLTLKSHCGVKNVIPPLHHPELSRWL